MRDEILTGKLNYPGTAIFDKYPEQEDDIKSFFKAVWYNFLNNQSTNGIHHYEKLGRELYNDVVRRLCHNGWLISHSLIGRKWASVELVTGKLLEFVTKDELEAVKARYKYSKYLLGCNESTKSTSVRQNGEVKETGLERKGFMEAGNSVFGFDTVMASKYEEAIAANLTKSMSKIREVYEDMETNLGSYDEVSERLLEHHIEYPLTTYTTGDSLIDSRGRAVSSCLSKVFNPIGNKDARALLVLPY